MAEEAKPTTKVYIFEPGKWAEAYSRMIFQISRLERKMPLEVKICNEDYVPELPRGYDIYVLRISGINEKNLRQLRSDQPYSYFVGLGRVDLELRKLPNMENILKLFHETMGVLEFDKYIVRRILSKEGWINKPKE